MPLLVLVPAISTVWPIGEPVGDARVAGRALGDLSSLNVSVGRLALVAPPKRAIDATSTPLATFSLVSVPGSAIVSAVAVTPVIR